MLLCSWAETPGRKTGSETPGATPSQRMWDATPGHATPGAVTPGRDTPGGGVTPSARKNRWDETPKTERGETAVVYYVVFRQILTFAECC